MKISNVIFESIILAIVSIFVGMIFESNKIFFFIPANYLPSVVEVVKEGNVVGIVFLGIMTSVIAAFFEELIFRFLPFKVWSKWLKTVPYWLMGFFTAFFFALVHTNTKNGFEFPLLQFILGLYLWSLIRYKNGYRLAATGHFIFNLTIFITMAIFSPFLL